MSEKLFDIHDPLRCICGTPLDAVLSRVQYDGTGHTRYQTKDFVVDCLGRVFVFMSGCIRLSRLTRDELEDLEDVHGTSSMFADLLVGFDDRNWADDELNMSRR